MNLMTRATQTNHLTASDHLKGIERAVDKSCDWIVINHQPIPAVIAQHYAVENEHPVIDNLGQDGRVIRASLLSRGLFKVSPADTAHRSLLRHDSHKLKLVLAKILRKL